MSDDSPAAKILNDIDEIYACAMKKGNFMAALRAKELLGRQYGLFSFSPKKKPLSLKDLTDAELQILIKEIEEIISEEE